jgi:hypothetical protein
MMGHDISMRYKDQEIAPFKVVGEGNYVVGQEDQSTLYITHNLSKMIYLALESIGLKEIKSFGEWLNNSKASEIVESIRLMHDELVNNPQKYEPLNPENGWGSYSSLCAKIKMLLEACEKYPECRIYDWY